MANHSASPPPLNPACLIGRDKIKRMSEIKPKSKRGGKREGAGRKRSSKDRIARDVTKQRAAAVQEAVVARLEQRDGKADPVEVIMEIAQWAREEWARLGNVISETGQPDQETMKLRLQCGALAVDWASKAAPYIRPRLNAVEAKVNVNVTIYERIERSRRRVAIAA